MSDMFKNYPQPEDYIPDNRPRRKEKVCLDIMSGETAIHTFEIPLNVDEDCSELEVIYKLGLNPIIIKTRNAVEVSNDDSDNSIIICTLSPEETALFADTFLRAEVQIKFYMNEGVVAYSEIYRIRLLNSLDTHKPQPEPDEGE